MKKNQKVSVLVPISERHGDLEHLFAAHRQVLEELGSEHEFIFVLDGDFPAAAQTLDRLRAANPDSLRIIRFPRSFGEARALSAAFAMAGGDLILTLPAYMQINPGEIGKLFATLEGGDDLVIGSRFPRRDSWFNRMQAGLFHRMIRRLTKESFRDISSGVRLLRREVLEQIELYGDLHRFLPLLALQKGFRVREIPLAQACEDCHLRVYAPGVYGRRLLDLLTIFFLFKFTQKPLRFFGIMGGSIGMLGSAVVLLTVYQRVFLSQALADRPLFLIGVLFALAGMQTFFIGLVGEIIIFTHMPSKPAYTLDQSTD